MATYITQSSGLWSAGTTWVGGATPPSESGHKIIIAPGHAVTYDLLSGEFGDGTSTYGTGTSTTSYNNLSSGNGIFIGTNATLSASRTTTTALSVRGTMVVSVSGKLDWGSTSDPITSASATITLGYFTTLSATSANRGSTGIFLTTNTSDVVSQVPTNTMSFCGIYRDRNVPLTLSAAAGSTTLEVASSNGWSVGDKLIIESDTVDTTRSMSTTITNVTGNTITISPGLNFSRAAGTFVGNLASNVVVRSHSAQYPPFGVLAYVSNTSVLDIKNTRFEGLGWYQGWVALGTSGAGQVVHASYAGLTIRCDFMKLPYTIDSIAIDNTGCGSSPMLYATGLTSQLVTVKNSAFYTNATAENTNHGIYLNALVYANINNCVVYRSPSNVYFGTAFPADVTLENCRFNAAISNFGSSTNGLVAEVNNCVLRSNQQIAKIDGIQSLNFNSCSAINNAAYGIVLPNPDSIGSVYFKNCTFSGGTIARQSNNLTNKKQNIYVFQPNLSANDYRRFNYYYYGQTDSLVRKNGVTSFKIKPEQSNVPFEVYFTIPATAGITQTIVGNLRFDSSYGVTTPPSISFVGAGVNQSFTCSGVANTWQSFNFTLNPTSTQDIKITIIGQSASTSGYVYVDGLFLDPFVTNIRHYGYRFDNRIDRVVDENITLAESAVSTLTAATCLDDVYDLATYWSVTHPGVSSYTDLVAVDGYELDFGANNIVVDNAAPNALDYDANISTITIAASTLGVCTKFNTIRTTGSFVLSGTSKLGNTVGLRTSNFDSELIYGGADSITVYSTYSDAQNTINPGPSANDGILRFEYGQTYSGVVLSGTVYIRWVAGAYVDIYAGTIAPGRNELGELTTQSGLAIAISNMNIINTGVQQASKLIPHTTNVVSVTGLTVQVQTLINEQQIINEGVKRASILVPHNINLI